jgi:polyhydroxybutyrate depolymerase
MHSTKFLAGALLVALLSPCSGAIGAEIRSGNSCTKLNATTQSNGLRFTCVKSGKKLIWSKGVKISSKATPSVIPEPEFDLYAGISNPLKAITTSVEQSLQTSDGKVRTYRLFIPHSLTITKPAPLVIALHGGLGSATQFEANSGLSDFSESNGFYVAYPNGVGAIEGQSTFQTWNAGDCCGPAAKNNVNDVSFIRTLISTLQSKFAIDTKKVFIIGHSNGAMMAYKLVCELSDQISGIGVQAGSLGMDECKPSQPVSVIHIHGTSDSNFPISGGLGSGVAAIPFRSARFAVDTIASANKCEINPEALAYKRNTDLTIYTWNKCANSSTIRYVTVKGATHAWMGHPAQSNLAQSYVGAPYENLDATRAILSFLLSRPLS